MFKSIFITLIAFITFISGAPGKENVSMIAHRGYSSKYHQNTEEAFIGAGKHGAGGAETDVRVTKDGVLVLSHNEDIEMKDGTKLIVADSTYEELTAQPIKNKKTNTDLYICTFERYLEICKEYNMICFIELKAEFSDEMIIKMFDLAKEVYDLDMCEFQSFNFDNLVRVHELYPELKIMLTYGEDSTGYERCFDYGFDIDVDYKVITKDMVEEFHSRGLKIGVWTCNSPCSLYYSYWLGVDYIESDKY